MAFSIGLILKTNISMSETEIKVFSANNREAFLANLPHENWAVKVRESIETLFKSRGHLNTLRILEARFRKALIGALVHEPLVVGEAHFHWVSVKPQARRKGVATKLFLQMRDNLVSEAKGHRLSDFTITADAITEEGTFLLNKMGFKKTEFFWRLEINFSQKE